MKAFLAIALTASVLSVGFISTNANAVSTRVGGGNPGGGNPGGGSGGSHGLEGMYFSKTCDLQFLQKKLVNGKKIWIKRCDYIR